VRNAGASTRGSGVGGCNDELKHKAHNQCQLIQDLSVSAEILEGIVSLFEDLDDLIGGGGWGQRTLKPRWTGSPAERVVGETGISSRAGSGGIDI
jgi:hypothetical protein